jgi:DNA-binding GntR family transcriptional regulator
MAGTRKKHSDRVYDLVVDRIQRGDLGREERVVDVAMAADLGLSRMPVRDALMRLVHEGYLERTTRGFMLPSLTRREVLEVFEIRRLLEPRAAALAAREIGRGALEAMAAAVDQAQAIIETGDVPHFFRLSERFRNGWLSAVSNATLQQTIQRYLAQVQAVRLATMGNRDTLRIIVAGQRDMLAAFTAHDSVSAADRVLRFVIEAEAAYRAAVPEGEAETITRPRRGGSSRASP